MQKSIFRTSIVLICLGFCVLSINAKISYLPKYYTQISLEEDSTYVLDSTITRDLALHAKDNRFSIYVMHDSLTKERVKAIKSYKTAQVFSSIAMATGFISAVTTPLSTPWDVFQYQNNLSTIAAATFLKYSSSIKAESLQQLPISILITNNSDKEIFVNDMSRGLVWYIRAYGSLCLNSGNPDINLLRISNVDTTNPQIAYAIIQSANYLYKTNLEYENANYWFIRIDKETLSGNWISRYFQIDKITMEEVELKSYDEIESIRRFDKKNK